MQTKSKYKNPIITGFNPDPSIVCVGEDYYLCTSSFEYFPGVPIYHSKNLVNWELIGHCLNRESQLDLKNSPSSMGVYAPTIRYYKGTYYMITTNITHAINGGKTGNLIVKTDDINGEWSEPIWVEHNGIDPSLYFEDDKVYCCGSDHDEQGDGIVLFEIDINTGKILSDKKFISRSCCGRSPEGPHIYKINDWYYLMTAEGGTEYGHMVIMQRSKNIYGPYEPCPYNPILSNRNFGSEAIQCTGHADLFEDYNGNWWLVCLGARPIGGVMLHNLGRETSLVPVVWKNGWPCPETPRLSSVMEGYLPGKVQKENTEFYTDFHEKKMPLQFNYLRNPDFENYILDSSNGRLILNGTEKGLSAEKYSPTFIGIRQKDFASTTTAEMSLDMEDGTKAGLTAYYINTHHYDIRLSKENDRCYVELNKRLYDLEGVTEKREIKGKTIEFKIESTRYEYRFSYSIDKGEFSTLGTALSAGLSTEVTEIMTFTGTFIGMFAQGGKAEFHNFKSVWERE